MNCAKCGIPSSLLRCSNGHSFSGAYCDGCSLDGRNCPTCGELGAPVAKNATEAPQKPFQPQIARPAEQPPLPAPKDPEKRKGFTLGEAVAVVEDCIAGAIDDDDAIHRASEIRLYARAALHGKLGHNPTTDKG